MGTAAACCIQVPGSTRPGLREIQLRDGRLLCRIAGGPDLDLDVEAIGHLELRSGGWIRIYAASIFSYPEMHLLRVPGVHAEDIFDQLLAEVLRHRSASAGPLSVLEREQLRWEQRPDADKSPHTPTLHILDWDGCGLRADDQELGGLDRNPVPYGWEPVWCYLRGREAHEILLFAEGVLLDGRACVLGWFTCEDTGQLQLNLADGEKWILETPSGAIRGPGVRGRLEPTAAGMRVQFPTAIPGHMALSLLGTVLWWQHRPRGFEAWMLAAMPVPLWMGFRPILMLAIAAIAVLSYLMLPPAPLFGGMLGLFLPVQMLCGVWILERVSTRRLDPEDLAPPVILACLAFFDNSPVPGILLALLVAGGPLLLWLSRPLFEPLNRLLRKDPIPLLRFPPLIGWPRESRNSAPPPD